MTKADVTTFGSVSQALDVHAEHNGVACIESLRPEDRGTKNQFWFTSKMLCEVFDVARKTLEDNIAALHRDDEFVSAIFRQDASILDLSGVPHKTTIYNLEVLNKLGMCCFRGNKKAKEIRNKFNDVLVKQETGTVANALPQSYAEALRALADEVEKHEQTRNALIAEQEQHKKDNEDYQNGLAIIEKQKVQISTKREATAMNTAKREKRRAELAEAETKRVTKENERLKNELGIGTDFIKTSQAKDKWIELFHHAPSGKELVKICEKNGFDYKDNIPDVAMVRGLLKQVFVNAYPREAWMIYYKDELQAKARMLPLG